MEMSLIAIDIRLKRFAEALAAEIVRNDNRGMAVPRNWETRRISWNNGEINTSIEIFPTITGENSQVKKWNFVISAWQDLDGERLMISERLVDSGTLKSITKNIDELLKKSLDSLQKMRLVDLQSRLEG